MAKRRFYRFPCGCEWPILGDPPADGALPLLDIDDSKIPEDCPAVWELLGKGLTKGVFQLEKPLGQTWSKRLKPECAEHLSALGALLRPGCLKAKNEHGVSMTEVYCRRKNGEEQVTPYHPVVDEVLAKTYGVLVYQEQAMELARRVAGFTLQEADALRKAIGKKLVEEMAKCRKMFLDGAAKVAVVSVTQAEELFGWIEKSQRYSFNKCIDKNTLIYHLESVGCQATVQHLYRCGTDRDYATHHGCGEVHDFKKKYGHYGYGLSLTDRGVFEPNIISDIQPAGVRPILKVWLESFGCIRVTENHKFPTPGGKLIRADELKAGDLLYVHRGDLAPDTVAVKEIGPAGESETYDVTMDAPHHNFVANRIVTCNSHAMSYGLLSYETSYRKAHDPVSFFANYLCYSEYKSDPREENAELVNDAKLFDVPVDPPDLRDLDLAQRVGGSVVDANGRTFEHDDMFSVCTDGVRVRFGFKNIKGVGKAQVLRLFESYDRARDLLGRPLASWRWEEFLVHCSASVSSSVARWLIQAGACRWTGKTRTRMLNEFSAWEKLTDKEREWTKRLYEVGQGRAPLADLCAAPAPLPDKPKAAERRRHEAALTVYNGVCEAVASRPSTLPTLLQLLSRPKDAGGGVANERRGDLIASEADLLDHPPAAETDHPNWVAWVEEQLMGVSLTCSRVDACDINAANCTCKDFVSGRDGFISMAVEVKAVREIKTKTGKNPGQKMAFLTVADGSCALSDVTAFSEAWKAYGSLLSVGNTVLIQGERDKKRGSLVVNAVYQL